jgi:hypothetical protein
LLFTAVASSVLFKLITFTAYPIALQHKNLMK